MHKEVRAAVLTGPGKIEITDYPYPKLEEGCAIIRTELSGICGTDKHTFRGEIRQYEGTSEEITTPFPIDDKAKTTMDFSGERLEVGDRVVMCPDVACGSCWFCKHIAGYPWCDSLRSYGNSFSCAQYPHLFGGWSQYMYITPDVKIYKVPDGLKPEIAVFAELMDVTYSLDKAKELYAFDGEGFAFGDTVVIQGAGPLGMMPLIKARMLGADKIIMTDKSEFRLKFAKKFGADVVICLKNTTEKERIDIVRDETGGRGGDVVVECAGEPEAFPEGIDMTRKAGVYLVVGNFVDTGRTVEIKPQNLCAKNIRVLGVSNHPITGYVPTLRMMQRYQTEYPIDKLITHRYGVAEAEAAVRMSMNYEQSMKVVIDPSINLK